MAKKTLWLATEEHGEFVLCPEQGMPMSPVGWNTSGLFLNGGGYAQRSTTVHRTYQPTFTGSQDDVQDVLDFPGGVFGDGPFYMVDPFSQLNTLPRWLSVPRLMAKDAPTFQRTTDNLYIRPTLSATPTNTLRLPPQSAVFTFVGTDTSGFTFKLPHPPGFKLGFQWWGSRTGGAHIELNGVNRDTPASVVTINDGDQVDNMFSTLQLVSDANGTITIAGIMVQLKLASESFDFTRFRSGRGTTQVEMMVQQVTGYSAARDRIAATIDVKEVGGWR